MGTIGGQAPPAEEIVAHCQCNPVIDQIFMSHLKSMSISDGLAHDISDSKSYFIVCIAEIMLPPVATVVRLNILSCPEKLSHEISSMAHEET